MKPLVAGVIIIVIILIFIIGANHYATKYYEDYLTGYWVSDTYFAEEAGISSIMMYINKHEKGKRDGYLVINNDISNQFITLHYNKPISVHHTMNDSHSIEAKVEFTDDNVWPENIIFEISPSKGRLRIHDGKKIYALLWKDHEISSALSIADVEEQMQN